MRVALHHPRAGRRLALRRGLEVAGFDVVVVHRVEDLFAGGGDLKLVAAAEATDFLRSVTDGPEDRLYTIVLGAGPTHGPIDARLPADAPVESLIDALRALDDTDRRNHRPARPSHRNQLVHAGGLDALEEKIDRLAAVDLSVLVSGESGVGKDLVARTLHDRGPRRDHPFVVMAVGATPADLLESALFGHVRGAFTDAVADRTGRLEAAGEGTLVLDEVADIPLSLQAVFLRVLQDRRFAPVGDGTERPFRARVLATTQRDLRAAVADGTFREDLYHRLAGAELAIPPLRVRPHDIAPLADHFAALHDPPSRLDDAARRRLGEYEWPGNARELDHVLQRARLLTDSGRIDEVLIETILADARGMDPDAALIDVLRPWIATRRARGESWTSMRQTLGGLLDRLRDDDSTP